MDRISQRRMWLAGASLLAIVLGSGDANALVFAGPEGVQYIIPLTGYYDFTLAGAQGGGYDGGFGAVVGGELFLEAGATLDLVVGGPGGSGVNYAGGGGGGSFVFDGELLFAAGGGGGSNFFFIGGGGGPGIGHGGQFGSGVSGGQGGGGSGYFFGSGHGQSGSFPYGGNGAIGSLSLLGRRQRGGTVAGVVPAIITEAAAEARPAAAREKAATRT